ncbi:MAG: subfamily B ATP-binding cassette protein MsbA [Marinoscillum sp.]|jgi:subfamily B ATP-binding cassette protein MsbA
MRLYLRILNYARPLGSRGVVYLLLVFGATVFGVINLTALIPLLQVLFESETTTVLQEAPDSAWNLNYLVWLFNSQINDLMILQGKTKAVLFICTFIFVAVFLANIFRYASQIILAKVRIKVIRRLREASFDAMIDLDMSYFTDQRKGDLISRFTTDMQEVEQSVVASLKVIIREPVLILGYLVALFMISPELTMYALLLVPITGFIVSLVARRIRKWALKSQESVGRMGHVMEESISGLRTIKGFGAEAFVRNRFRKEVTGYAKESFEIARKSNLASPISEVIGTGVLCILLILGGNMVLGDNATLSASQFIGFLIIFSQTLIPVKSISVAVSQINRGLAAGERVFQIMDTPRKIQDPKSPKVFNGLENGISFEKVSFKYDRETVLHGIDLEIKKGKSIALVGRSGSGKSTIADLVCRFHDPKEGRVMVDGKDLKTIAVKDWRDQLAVVSQQPVLFHDTIANNIAFGTEEATQQAIEESAKQAMAHDFIMSLPNGYQTIIGDMGNKLSGGERQRITIARAILKNPAVLILDEPTSSLDGKSEQELQESLRKVIKGRTSVIIAHKLSIAKLADEIIFIDKGMIIGRGTHEDLILNSIPYQQLTELQSF